MKSNKFLVIIVCLMIFLSGISESVYASPYVFDRSGLTDRLLDRLSMYNISLTHENINTIDNYSNYNDRVRGITDYVNRKIIVQDMGDVWYTKHIFHHEAGHAFDSVKCYSMDVNNQYPNGYIILGGNCSNTKEFQNIFLKEHNSIEAYSRERYSSERIEEYFAETFAWYIEEPWRLESSSPMTYSYFKRIYY